MTEDPDKSLMVVLEDYIRNTVTIYAPLFFVKNKPIGQVNREFTQRMIANNLHDLFEDHKISGTQYRTLVEYLIECMKNAKEPIE